MDRLTETKVSELAEAYRDHPLLWKVDHKQYKNRHARNQAYEDILKRLKIPGLTVSHVKCKIKNLRSSYYHELKRIAQAKKEGNSAYNPRVSWFSTVDRFLKNYQCSRQFAREEERNNSNADADDSNLTPYDEDGNGEDGNDEDGNDSMCGDNKFDVLGDADNIGSSQYFTEVELEQDPVLPDFVSSNNTQSISMKRKYDNSEFNTAVETLGNVTKKILKDNQNTDEYDVFGKYIAYALRNMGRKNAIIAKKEVQDVIARIQLQDFQESL